VNISYGPYFQEGPAEDVFKAAIATGHEIHADVQDLHKDIRGLKGVGVFSVSTHTHDKVYVQDADSFAEMGKIHLP
jgi:hypothetical protein